jgi:predicted O-methyltransferase YrrM
MSLSSNVLRVAREEGTSSLAKKSIIYTFERIMNIQLIGYIRVILCKRKLKKCFSKIRGIDDALEFVFAFKFLGISIKPAQVKEEITQLLKLLAKLQPKIVCEIGTAGGGTLFLFSRVSSPSSTIISIDLPGGPFGGGYPEWKIPFYKSFIKRGQRLYLIRADSHDTKTLEKVKRALGDKKIDFLFIDGDHTYEGVKKDFEMYSPLVRKRGIMAFHDICPHPPQTGCEVDMFWREIKDKYEHIEIVRDWKQGWAGIGVLHV